MDWIKGVQELITWLISLPVIPKAIISALIVGAAAFILVLIWTPQPETAITAILSDCYRRALFTRMTAQIDRDAMLASITKIRETLQRRIPDINRHVGRQPVSVNRALGRIHYVDGDLVAVAERLNQHAIDPCVGRLARSWRR